MNTTIFVVALTVFSSMFVVSSAEANCAVDDQKCKTILELIKISNECLDEINNAITDALAKASAEEKDVITNDIVYYMMGFNIIVPEIHQQLTEACNGGSEEEREKVIAKMEAAVTDTKSFLANLNSPQIPVTLKAVVDENCEKIINNAILASKEVKCTEN